MIAAALVVAGTIAPVFVPPLDVVLRYQTVELRRGKAGPERFTLLNELRFARDGAGFRLAITPVGAEAEAPPAARAAYRAGMAPFLGVTTRIAVSAAGEPEGVADPEGNWRLVLASVEAAATAEARAHGEAAARPLRATRAALAALPADAVRERLLDGAADLLGVRPPPLGLGEATALDGGGTLALERADGATLRYRLRMRQGQGPATLDQERILVLDRATGLLLECRTTSTARFADGRTEPAGEAVIRWLR